MLGSTVPLDPEVAEIIGQLTGTTCELADYDDAARAVRRWFAMMDEAAEQAKH